MKQFAKLIYSSVVRGISYLNKFSVKQKGIAYLLSFPGNDVGLITKIATEFPAKNLTIFYTKNCLAEAISYQEKGLRIIPLDNPVIFFWRVVPWLTKVNLIICDNYFAFLGDISLKATTQVVQIWHANGAIKTFGWEDKKTTQRSKTDQARFQRVYQKFTQLVVGSEAMATIFKNSYHLEDERILRIGLPRTDVFFDKEQQVRGKSNFYQSFPQAKNKKVVLYVPTYRDQGMFQVLDLAQLKAQLGSDYFILSKFHPHTNVSEELKKLTPEWGTLHLNDVLAQVDFLITDYSSIPFEYALANPLGKIIFYCPDLGEYQKQVGIQADFKTWVGENLVMDTAAVLAKIQIKQGLPAARLNQQWNHYNDGLATRRLLDEIKKFLGNEVT